MNEEQVDTILHHDFVADQVRSNCLRCGLPRSAVVHRQEVEVLEWTI